MSRFEGQGVSTLSISPTEPVDDALFLRGGGKTGALLQSIDWAATSLGPMNAWPQSLKTSTNLVLNSPLPIVLLWGEDGYMIYNDAYSVIAGLRHPALLGQKVREGWPEVADFNDNVMKIVLAGGTLAYVDQEMTLFRNGAPERVWMNLDYSPVYDEAGIPAGVIAIVMETTGRVLADRRNAAEQDRLRAMFNQAPGFMALLSGPEHVFTIANGAFEQLARRSNLVGQPIRAVFPNVEGQTVFEILDQCYRTGEPYLGAALPVLLRNEADGALAVRYLDLIYQPIIGSDGAVTGIFCEGADVTERVESDQALRESELRFRNMADHAPVIIWTTDATGQCTYLNRTWCEFTGLPESAGIGWQWFDSVHPDDRDAARARLRAAHAERQPFTLEYRLRHHDGTHRWSIDAASPRFDPKGEFLGYIGSVLDIHQRRAAEERLAESEARFRNLAEAMPQLVWSADPDGEVDYCNGRRREYLELTTATDPQSWSPIIHPDDIEMTKAAWEEASRTGESYSCEHRLALREGGWAWHVTRAVATRRADGGVAKWFGTATNIDELKIAQQTLQALNEDLEGQVTARTRDRDRVWRNSRDLIVVIDGAGVFRSVSPAWTTILGHAPDEVLGRKYSEFVWHEDAQSSEAAYETASLRNNLTNFENRCRHKDGTPRWISWNTTRERGLVYAYGRHISEEKRRIEEIASANRQLVAQIEERERVEATLRQMQRLEAVGQLTSGVAHDFNNLLTVISGNIDLMERGMTSSSFDAKNLARLGHMRLAAQRGAKLTAQLLAFSRRQRLEAKPLDMNETVTGMRDLIQSSMGGTIRVDAVLDPDLWPAMVDQTQIELVILNLAINARDAMEGGGVLTVATGNATLGAPERPEAPAAGDYVMVAVSDTGTGMPPDVLAKAFEPFFTTKPIGKGSGLGLAQVFGFAKQSGGGVLIETAVDVGTAIKVFLPRAPERRKAVDPEMVERAPPAPIQRGGHVLLVDDDRAVREITSSLLQNMGCVVVETGSGGAALELLEIDETPFDLLVVDFAMPGMNGVEVVREALKRRPGLPVLYVTGYADQSALNDVDDDQIVQKPFQNNELIIKARKALIKSPYSAN